MKCKRARPLLAFIIILIAAFLRLYRFDLIDLRFDEASALRFALDIIDGHWLSMAPYSGSVANHPPVYLYTLALPYLLTHDFSVVTAYRAMLDVLAVAVCWALCMRYFNGRVAVIATLLFATAPWAVYFSRNLGILQPPLFSAILLFGLLEALQRRNPWGWAIAGLGLALSTGSHLSALYLVPIVAVAVLLGRRTLRPMPVLAGLLPLAALMMIYLGYDATQGFSNARAILGFGGAPATFSLDSLRIALWQSGGAHLSDLTGGAYGMWVAQLPAMLNGVETLQIAVLASSIPLLAIICMRHVRCWNHAPWIGLWLLLAWWCIPVLMQMRHSQPIQMHYLLPLYPAPFILMGLGIDRVLTYATRLRTLAWLRTATATLAAVTLGVIALWQCTTVVRFADFVEQYDTSTSGYGLPVRSAWTAAQHARQAAAEGVSGDVVVVVPDYVTPWHEQGLLLGVVLADMPYRFLNSYVDGWIFRPEGTSYIFAPGTENTLAGLLCYLKPSDVITSMTPIRAELNSGYIYVRVKKMPDLSGFTQTQPAQWESGVELTQYRISSVNNAVRVETVLRVLQEPPQNVDYHWYNHLFDRDTKLGQLDGSGIHPLSWRVGDYLLQRFDIPFTGPMPSEPAYVRIGSYCYPEVQSVNVSENGKTPENGVNLAIKHH